ncbi:MAG TPA: NADPH:quinone oxidoreductase family protein [Magnetospirillaceae bacterium]|nr:NADPH:quinone oxidoreductase family protein [Magnetospirillaceae bacterium]
MKAMICRSLDEQARLELQEIPPPDLESGGVRIQVAAAGINFADTLVISGRYQERQQPPFAPGMEVAGRVVETAPGVSGFRAGDRVMASVSGGGYAEQVVAAAHDVTPIPDAMDFVTAAGFPCAYGTSHHSLTSRAGLKSGEVLLVHGAAGGVGLTAVEIGKALGATVIATAGSAEKLAVAKTHGADHLINYREEDVKQRVRAFTAGRGADVVYDPVGGAVFEASLRCTAAEGRLVVIGFASGEVPQIPANLLLVKNLTVIGYYWGAYRRTRPEELQQGFRDLLGWYGEGKIKPKISATFPLEGANEALELLRRRGSTGKVVLTLNPSL